MQVLGTHAGIIHLLDSTGERIKSYKPHYASIVDISLDTNAEFVATASLDGWHIISTSRTCTNDVELPRTSCRTFYKHGRIIHIQLEASDAHRRS